MSFAATQWDEYSTAQHITPQHSTASLPSKAVGPAFEPTKLLVAECSTARCIGKIVLARKGTCSQQSRNLTTELMLHNTVHWQIANTLHTLCARSSTADAHLCTLSPVSLTDASAPSTCMPKSSQGLVPFAALIINNVFLSTLS